jgi:DNA-binding transcriptional MerR regulator
MSHTVGEVARLAHVSVRTLHHYDEVGLLEPSARSEAGYRLYEEADLERLQEVLFFRELGFSLEEIAALMEDPAVDRRAALHMQRGLLAGKAWRLRAMIDAVDRALRATMEGGHMDTEGLFEVFGDFDPAEHEDEARERWGDTDAYAESARRTARYSKEDWVRFKEESDEINGAIAALIDEGVAPDDPRATDAVERARLQIDEWFYPCSREMHAELGRSYVADPRFEATYEKIRPGMAQYMRDATAANLTRGEDGR